MGTILGIYLGTVIVSNALFYLGAAVEKAKLNREGYIHTTKLSTPEKIKDVIGVSFILAIPTINIAIAVGLLFDKELYEKSKREGIADGTIIKKDDAILEAERKLMLEKELSKRKNLETINRIDKQNKPYSAMTPDEKLLYLARERAYLLSQKESETTKSYNDRGAYHK